MTPTTPPEQPFADSTPGLDVFGAAALRQKDAPWKP